jgi:hypothetical protein
MACNFPNSLEWVISGLQMNDVTDAPCWFTKHNNDGNMNPVRSLNKPLSCKYTHSGTDTTFTASGMISLQTAVSTKMFVGFRVKHTAD